MINVKKNRLGFIVFVLAAFSLNSCAEKKENVQDREQTEVLAPNQIIPIAEAKGMYDNYSNRRVPLIQKYEDSINDNKEKFDVARYVSYDYETIKQYLAYIEQEAQKANVEISGLRFYFSNYPNEAFFPGTKDSLKHPRQNSILLSPTLKRRDRDYLFYVEGDGEQGQAVLLSDSFGEIKGMGNVTESTKTSYASMLPSLNMTTTSSTNLYGRSSLTMNRGTGAPPPYNEE